MTEERTKYWFNMKTKQVEVGKQSAALFRVGPFATFAEAQKAEQARYLQALLAGTRWEFESFPEYLALLERNGVVPNVVAFAGHSSIRTWVMGADASSRAATDDEIARMATLVREAIAAGAVGLGLDGALRATWRASFAAGEDTTPYLFLPALYVFAAPVLIVHNTSGHLVLLWGLVAGLAFGALAVAAPILFHLIRQTSKERTEFSSLMFLEPGEPRRVLAKKVQYLLLLALRIGVLVLRHDAAALAAADMWVVLTSHSPCSGPAPWRSRRRHGSSGTSRSPW